MAKLAEVAQNAESLTRPFGRYLAKSDRLPQHAPARHGILVAVAVAEGASLSTVQTRLGWARQYTDELKQASREFMRNDPEANSAVDCKRDAGVGRTAFVVHLPNGFPEDFGRLIGDAFHHLRSALDNLAYQLVLANGGTPTKATAFPILWDCKDRHFQAAAAPALEGMSKPARAAIQRLQPFNEWPERPKDTTLWLINELNNIDKHRIPHLACLWIATCEGTLFAKPKRPGVTYADFDARITQVLRRG